MKTSWFRRFVDRRIEKMIRLFKDRHRRWPNVVEIWHIIGRAEQQSSLTLSYLRRWQRYQTLR